MDRMKVAAAVLALATLAEPAFAQEGNIVNMWPKTGEWVTVLTNLPNGGVSCSSVTGPQKSGTGEKVSFGFAVSEQRTHFYLNLRGAEPMNPSSLQIEASGLILVDMPLIQHLDKDGAQVMEVDIPGDSFVRVVRLNLVRERQVAIRAGDKTYVLAPRTVRQGLRQPVGLHRRGAPTQRRPSPLEIWEPPHYGLLQPEHA
jgi:hypothetical protein